MFVSYLIISHRAEGPGREILQCPPPPPSVRPVTFSFRTVTRKRIDVFSRNFAGTCTMSWGVLYSFWYWWNVVEFFLETLFLISFCVLCYFQHYKFWYGKYWKVLRFFKISNVGGGGNVFLALDAISNISTKK